VTGHIEFNLSRRNAGKSEYSLYRGLPLKDNHANLHRHHSPHLRVPTRRTILNNLLLPITLAPIADVLVSNYQPNHHVQATFISANIANDIAVLLVHAFEFQAAQVAA